MVFNEVKTIFHPEVASRGHLLLKRLDQKDLTPGALADWKKNPHHVSVDRAPTNRATCIVCGKGVVKNVLRVTFMLQCHKGYKNASQLHLQCLSKHPESAKIASIAEFKGYKLLEPAELKQLKEQFEARPTKIFVEEKEVKTVKKEEVEETVEKTQATTKGKGAKRKAVKKEEEEEAETEGPPAKKGRKSSGA